MKKNYYKKREPVLKVCDCGEEFIAKRKDHIHCHPYCSQKYNPNKPIWDAKRREWKLKKNYGISVEDYNAMFIAQEGRCKICKRHQTELKKNLHVDHKHSDGTVRSLLCQKCNHAIGLLNDDPSIIAAALEYVS